MADGSRSRLDETMLVAGLTFRDLLRRPGGWIATLLTAVLFAVLIGSVGLSAANRQTRAEARSFSVAIGGDVAGAARTIDALREDPRIGLKEVANAPAEVTESRSSSGIVFPPRTDERLAAGEDVEIQLFNRASNPISVESFNTVVIRLQEIELERALAARGAAATIGGAAEVEIHEVGRDEEVMRVQFARQVAPVGGLLCIGVVTAVAAVLGNARERRSIEPLLVLPLRRASIAGGISGGAYPLGALQLLVGIGLLIAAVLVPGSSLQQPAAVVASMFVAGSLCAALLALVATAFGCFAGSLGTGSDDAVSLGDLVAIVFVIVGVTTYAAPTLDAPIWYATPVLGQVLLLRDALAGTVTVGPAFLATAVGIGVYVALVHLAGARLDDDRRASRVPG